MIMIGVDPGIGGGIARLAFGRIERVEPMPVFRVNKKNRVDPDGLARIVAALKPDHAIVEQVNSRPGEGHAGAFSFGTSYGVILGVLAGLGIARTAVAPIVWKRGLHVPADKDAARARASQLFPGAAHLWPRKMDDGLAEAALLALWGARQMGVAENSIEW